MIFDGLDPDRLVYSSGTCSTMTSKISSDGSAPALRKSRGAAGASVAARALSLTYSALLHIERSRNAFAYSSVSWSEVSSNDADCWSETPR
jgi:hypothetical protein